MSWKDETGCPKLFLAPMEGLADGAFRRAITVIGGFDEACTEFLRVPRNAHVVSLAKRYDPDECAPIPQACQLMGGDPDLMAAMAREVERRGAPRIDINCGCPSNTVTGRGAGASLLKEPSHLHEVTKAVVEAVDIPVTSKLRSGFADTSLFKENLLAAQEAGIAFLTLHPRTKLDGYGPPARWELIAEAKALLDIPVIGNGDIRTASDVPRMLRETACDGVMIGRGAVSDPWLFHRVRAHYKGEACVPSWELTEAYLAKFYAANSELRSRTQSNKLKQLARFLLEGSEDLKKLLTWRRPEPASLYLEVLEALRRKIVEKKRQMAYN